MSTEWAEPEMAGAQVGDRRLAQGVGRVLAALAAQPQASFSAACGPARRQVAARLFRRTQITPTHLLAGHFAQTAQRCAAHPLILAVQDTTDFDFSHHPATRDLGPISHHQDRHGLFGHAALALSPTGEPLGLLHLAFWTRDPAEHGQTQERRQRLTLEKESAKWSEGLAGVEQVLPPGQRVLVIQDREGDVFAFLAAPRRPHTQLLVRAAQARKVQVLDPEGTAPAPDTLFAVAAAAPVVGKWQLTVPVKASPAPQEAGAARTARRPVPRGSVRGRHVPAPPPARREERVATLTVQVTGVELQPPRHAKAGEPRTPQRVWVVRAAEADPPPGVEAIEWVLLSTAPVLGAEAARQLVEYYALRWRIERLHYTLKSGCTVEDLQHETAGALQQVLALYYVVAWRLLWLTYVARVEPERPAAELLEPAELAVLRQQSRQPVTQAREVVRAIARLAGWQGYRSAPEPGVKMLWQGLRRLQDMAVGWQLAHAAPPDALQA